MNALAAGPLGRASPSPNPYCASRSASESARDASSNLGDGRGDSARDIARTIGFHRLLVAAGGVADVSTVLDAIATVSRDERVLHGPDWVEVAISAAAQASEIHTCWADDPIWCALVRDRGTELTWSVIYRDGWEAHRRSTAVLQRRLARAVVERHRKPARCWFTEDKVRYAQWLGGSEIDRACGYVRFEWRPERVS